MYKNLFRHFFKEQANKLVDCHTYNNGIDPPPSPPPKSRMSKPLEDQNVSNFEGRDAEGPSFPLSKKVWQVARA